MCERSRRGHLNRATGRGTGTAERSLGTAQCGPVCRVVTIPSMPPVIDPNNLYSKTTAGHLSPAVAGALERVYVPNVRSNDVDVIDPATLKVVDHFKVRGNPQHVVPSWDLKTLWVAGSGRRLDPQSHANRPDNRQG
jgi:YVTN family beta-propeller protein